ncbi:plastid division protein CDP1, chloroplastic-like [Chenopodium quinoa]|uniref:ARC6 IMS domain-containing protein n=1 Tax=Chenopodium quinoa TaxID=63459 RepID=A0A803M0V1_CHEQI|nr:plastid division protein CDP1, chloroplastic-like [Chenopodium quinoa]
MAPIPILLTEIASSSHCCSFNSPLCSRRRSSGTSTTVAGGGFLSLPEASHCSRRFSSFSSLICCAAVIYRRHHHHHRSVERRRWSVNVNASATAFRALDAHVNGHNTSNHVGVEIPVSCYQIIGVPDKAEKDQIVKSVMDLKNAEVEEGYTMEAVVSRQDLLMDVRDKLLFEPEYAGDIKENIPPKSTLRIPWAWLPGALCLLQEVGEEKLVLDIGRAALLYPDAKPHAHDVLLSMALAECAIAKIHLEKNKVSQGFEALARAQCLLRSKTSLGKMKLLLEIEESLEGLAPACTLELLAMPQTTDNAERRRGAMAALRELLRQGLDVEASCRVSDWPCFLSNALGKLTASEVVDLIPWDNLALTRKNKKSLGSQNQRVVIDFDCFYTALMAHIAFGFSSRQRDWISKARSICECLMASDGVDLKLEEAFCLHLLGQGSEADTLERLRQVESSKNSGSRNSLLGKEGKDAPASDYSLEKWLKDAVLCLFSDTRDCSPSLAGYFGQEKKSFGNKQSRGLSPSMPNVNHRTISPAVLSDQMVSDERLASLVSSQHLGPAVKQLTPTNLRSPLQEAKPSTQTGTATPPPQLKRDLGSYHHKAATSWMAQGKIFGRITFVAVLGCVVFATSKMLGRQSGRVYGSRLANRKTLCSSLGDHSGHNGMHSNFAAAMQQFLSTLKLGVRNQSNTGKRQKSSVLAGLSSPVPAAYDRVMTLEEAEALVRQWQVIKAEALGPDHQVHLLFDILDESMLLEWQALADAAKDKSCFWRFVLLQLSVLRADTFSDATGTETAEIDVLLEEAAELIEENQQRNPNYYSTYKISYLLRRQDDGSWKFCKADVDNPS